VVQIPLAKHMQYLYTTNMDNTVSIIESLTDGMEVIEMTSSTPAVAYRFGQAQAAKWTARGYASECIGVIAHTSLVEVDGDLSDGQSLADVSKMVIEQAGYRPVVREVK
jgi:hypothetical protein